MYISVTLIGLFVGMPFYSALPIFSVVDELLLMFPFPSICVFGVKVFVRASLLSITSASADGKA
jgi:hypothetical protein